MNSFLNNDIFNSESINKYIEQFNSNQPYRHFIIDGFLNKEFANLIYLHFPPIDSMKVHYHGFNEKKSEHSNFENLSHHFTQLREILSMVEFTDWLKACTGNKDLLIVKDRLGYGLHQGENGSFLDIHIDYNIHPTQKILRKLNLILFFNPQWEVNWGGELEMWDSEVKNCIQKITPAFNRCVIFECSDISYHGYGKITVPDGVTRKSFYQYYFIPINSHISYHDTVFKSRPKETLIKKILTPLKEFAKNNVKRTLLKLGFEKYLK